MSNLYYRLVVSTVSTIRKSGNFNENWRTVALLIISSNFMLNLLSIWLILDKFFHGFTNFLVFDIGTNKHLSSALIIGVYFLLPVLILNYFLAFKDHRYEYL